MPMLCSLGENSVKIFESSINSDHHLPSLRTLLWAGVNRSMESVTDLLDTDF